MRSSIVLAALALALGWTAPSGAQMMCGPGQTGSTASAQSSGGGMMCGMMRPAQAQTLPQQQQRQGMCACCQRMAMMQPQQGRSMPGMGGMGGMDMTPRQQQPAPEQSTPGAQEAPKQ